MSKAWCRLPLIIFLAAVCLPANGQKSVADLLTLAVNQSQITLPGSRPFHLKAKVVESTNLENEDYRAEVEEWWVAPDKWRRTIKSPAYSETLIVNSDKTGQQIDGKYSPHWLRTIVAAIFDPGAPLKGLDLSASGDNPMIGGTQFCRRFAYRAGIPPVGNNVFSTYCFEKNLLRSVGTPGYEAEYLDYKRFDDKRVARRIKEDIESGTELEATIDVTDLGAADESMFAVQGTNTPLRTVVVNEETMRGLLLGSPDLRWPPIEGGKSSGVLSIYECVDREGQVRETYPLNSDHPEMTDAARKQISDWRFKPASSGGVSLQVESILTFAYQTTIEPRSNNSRTD